MKVAAIQFSAIDDTPANLSGLEPLIRSAHASGARLIALPETVYYRGKLGSTPALDIPNDATDFISRIAKELGVWIHGGTFAEKTGAKAHNTSFVCDPSGHLVAKYRKVHLFDVEIPDMTITESKHTKPGDEAVDLAIGDFRAGLLTCYDLRFPGIWSVLRERGVDLFILPANFTRKTGEAHWEILLRARAVETQSYVVAPGQWGFHPGIEVPTYGRSMIIDPWGRILADAGMEGDGFAIADLDPAVVMETRRNMPVFSHRREDLY